MFINMYKTYLIKYFIFPNNYRIYLENTFFTYILWDKLVKYIDIYVTHKGGKGPKMTL